MRRKEFKALWVKNVDGQKSTLKSDLLLHNYHTCSELKHGKNEVIINCCIFLGELHSNSL